MCKHKFKTSFLEGFKSVNCLKSVQDGFDQVHRDDAELFMIFLFMVKWILKTLQTLSVVKLSGSSLGRARTHWFLTGTPVGNESQLRKGGLLGLFVR